MPTTADKWFYSVPENKPYQLAERVRLSLWEQRLGTLWLDTVRAEAPFLMEGTYNGGLLRLEWEPLKWLRLSSATEATGVAQSMKNLLRRPATMRYDNADGHAVWEWWVEGAERRWQEIQGKPAYSNPVRLDVKA